MNSSVRPGPPDEAADTRLAQAMQAFQAGDLKQALEQCLRIIDNDPHRPPALHLLSTIYLQSGHLNDAHQCSQSAVSNAPSNAIYLNGLGLTLHALGRLEDAEATFEKAITLQSDLPDLLNNKAAVQIDRDHLTQALETLRDALRLEPSHSNALVNKALVLQKMGRTIEGMEYLDQAFEQQPQSIEIAHNRLMMLNYSSAHSAADVLEHTTLYWRLKDRLSPPIKPFVHSHQFKKKSKKPLRIGYVSADLFDHPVGRILLPILKAHNKQDFSLFLYANNVAEDHVSKEMKSNDCTWHEIYNKSDDDVATQIKKDGIDVLIDLSGHTDGNRLGVFRHKPAPIQMTWLGHVSTTGLSEIDYIIADRFVLPEGDERFYTESALRLPNAHLCFSPPGETPAPQHASAGSDSFITFGCFSNIKKLNERVISTWSRILERVPESKLLIKNASLSNDAIAQSVRQQFSDSGTPRDQVIVLGKTNYNDHINTFGHVDIALDTFPYGGMTTTLETLWMGVPVIALAGQSWAGRVSASILTLMGTPELITRSEEEYIAKAVTFAQDQEGLAAIRRNTRVLLESSPLCDISRFTKSLECLYQNAWQAHCQA